MQDPVEPGSGPPHSCQSILECELLVGTPSRRALWPAVMRAAATGRTHGRTDQPCRSVKQIPCQRGAVHIWHTRDLSSKAAILTEADTPKAQRISLSDPLRTILRLGHVAGGAIVPTANNGRNRFGKFSAPVDSKSRKRTFLRMTPSFLWTATDLCSDRFADPVPVEGNTLVKRRHMTVSVVS